MERSKTTAAQPPITHENQAYYEDSMSVPTYGQANGKQWHSGLQVKGQRSQEGNQK